MRDDTGNNLQVYRGDDEAWEIRVREFTYDAQGNIVLDDDRKPVLVPTDITGWSFQFCVKKNENDPDSKAVIPRKNITAHIDAEQGISQIEVTAEETSLPIGIYYYDVQRVDDQGKIKTFMKGRFEVSRDITQGTS